MQNVKCEKCGIDLVRMEPRNEYTTRLLDDAEVVLSKCVEELKCLTHPEVSFVSIPDLPGLVSAAAITRCMHARKLSGRDIRFLRKATKTSSKELAERLQVTPEAVSRWEHGKSAIEPASEKLLRLFVGFLLTEQAPGVDFDPQFIASMRIEPVHDPKKPLRMEFFRAEVKLQRNKPLELKWLPEQRAVNEQ